jgi:hypothetical protein
LPKIVIQCVALFGILFELRQIFKRRNIADDTRKTLVHVSTRFVEDAILPKKPVLVINKFAWARPPWADRALFASLAEPADCREDAERLSRPFG